jgi:hypothetical protein
MSRFRPIDRDTPLLLPPSVQEWLPEGPAPVTWWKWSKDGT